MVSDVKTIFSGNASMLDKVLAGGDLLLNVAMDASMLIGVGERLKAAYVGMKVAGPPHPSPVICWGRDGSPRIRGSEKHGEHRDRPPHRGSEPRLMAAYPIALARCRGAVFAVSAARGCPRRRRHTEA
jgi:hypothetical protein